MHVQSIGFPTHWHYCHSTADSQKGLLGFPIPGQSTDLCDPLEAAVDSTDPQVVTAVDSSEPLELVAVAVADNWRLLCCSSRSLRKGIQLQRTWG